MNLSCKIPSNMNSSSANMLQIPWKVRGSNSKLLQLPLKRQLPAPFHAANSKESRKKRDTYDSQSDSGPIVKLKQGRELGLLSMIFSKKNKVVIESLPVVEGGTSFFNVYQCTLTNNNEYHYQWTLKMTYISPVCRGPELNAIYIERERSPQNSGGDLSLVRNPLILGPWDSTQCRWLRVWLLWFCQFLSFFASSLRKRTLI